MRVFHLAEANILIVKVLLNIYCEQPANIKYKQLS